MAYQDENTRWRFTVPQAGEVDSAESVEKRMVEIDTAILGPMEKAELVSNGDELDPSEYGDGDTSQYSTEPDEYWTDQEGRDIYVTRRHFHPTQQRVPYADEAGHAAEADHAENADWAGYLKPGFNLNGYLITGKSSDGTTPPSHTLKLNDIPDAGRVFWGKQEPSKVTSFPALRKGDLYVMVL